MTESPFIINRLRADNEQADWLMMRLVLVHWVLAALLAPLVFSGFYLGLIGGGITSVMAWLGYHFFRGTLVSRAVFTVCLLMFTALFIQQLKLEEMPPGVAPLPLGDSDQMEVGDEVFVVGAPYGLSHTLTVGHLSARHAPNRVAGNLTAVELFQTDAAINTGNSGGPMFNVQGEVVGIVSHILSQSGGFEGLGFAVTSKAARDLLLEQPSFWSGLEGYLLTGELAALLNVPQPAGVLVQRVAAQSPAADLGLEPGVVAAQIGDETLLLGGDIILEVFGIPITGEGSDFQRIQTALAQHPADTPISVKVLRGGQVLELSAPWPRQ